MTPKPLKPWQAREQFRALTLAERIVYIRTNLRAPERPGKPNLNQAEFATLVGVSDRQVKRWEKSDTAPEPLNRLAIAALTPYEPDDLRQPIDEAELRAVRRELDRLLARVAELEAQANP